MTDNFEDVPDSTDWLTTPLSSLSAVEAALRCQICKDFFKTPMLTSCCHTFCSLCIRRALSNDGKCPLCRASDQELKLRSNWALEEIVESFVKARKATLDFARTAGKTTASGSSPKRKLVKEDSPTDAHQPDAKRLRSSSRLSKTRSGQPAASVYRAEDFIHESRVEEEEEREEDEKDDATFTTEDGLVPCPICQTRMKQFQVFRHLDSCPGPQTQTPRASTSRIPTPNTHARSAPHRQTPAPERLPAIAYSMLKDAALRKKMSDLGLSTNGTRLQLEKRHKEWVTIWNANCDSAHPKRRVELLHDLDVWERTQGARAPVFAARPGASVKDKEFDGAAWAAKHDASFQDLVANARKSRVQAIKKAEGSKTAGSGAVKGSGVEVALVDSTKRAIGTEGLQGFPDSNMAQRIATAPNSQPPSATYHLQDGYSEQMPSVELGTGNSQETR